MDSHKENHPNERGPSSHEMWQQEIDFYKEQLKDAPDVNLEIPEYDITKFPPYHYWKSSGMRSLPQRSCSSNRKRARSAQRPTIQSLSNTIS